MARAAPNRLKGKGVGRDEPHLPDGTLLVPVDQWMATCSTRPIPQWSLGDSHETTRKVGVGCGALGRSCTFDSRRRGEGSQAADRQNPEGARRRGEAPQGPGVCVKVQIYRAWSAHRFLHTGCGTAA